MSLASLPTYYDEQFLAEIEPTALGFLRQLNGLTIIDLKGKDSSRTRVVTTLIHGNEPSGFIACHLWLRSQAKPQTNLRIIICNPEAARTPPMFSNRYIASSQDLNRYFDQPVNLSNDVVLRANQIKKAVQEINPEAIVDLHNTSGASPAFAVAVKDCAKTLALTSIFTQKLILTGLKVGAIMEQEFNSPIVTIECGGANEVSSHQVATDGLYQYFTLNNLFSAPKALSSEQVKVYRHPLRVELVGDSSVGFSHHRLAITDITLRADLEQLNRELTPAGEFLGWYEIDQPTALIAIDEEGNDQIEQLLEFKDGCLFTRKNLQFFMVTTILEIATRDCLFYLTTVD